ncbi:MAG TPA: hypothetical protein PLL69_12105 [Gemmatimonadales bacterium]|nr:hypothetical protein [Gemmatimonadales bacterium]
MQTRVGTGPARDTLRYDRSGNLIQRRNGLASYNTEFIYPSASNRLGIQRDSMVGTSGHTDRNFSYDAAGNRFQSAQPTAADTTVSQYDAVGRMVGTARRWTPYPLPPAVAVNFNACLWHPSSRLGRPCGGVGKLGFVGENVTRSSLGPAPPPSIARAAGSPCCPCA